MYFHDRIPPNQVEIVTRDSTVYPADSFKIHEGYNALTKNNDIALVRTSDSIKFNSIVQQAWIPTASPVDGSKFFQLAAWNPPQEYGAWIISWTTCQGRWGPVQGANMNNKNTCLDKDRHANNVKHVC